METNNDNKSTISYSELRDCLKSRFFLVGVALVFFIWIFDPLINAVFLHQGTIFHQLTQLEPHETYMQLVISAVIIIMSFIGSFMLNRSRQAKEALTESEKKYRTLFEQSTDAILIIEDDKFVDCNPATVTMLGYKNKEELLDTHPSELSPEMQSDGRSSFEKANEMMLIAFDQGSHLFEWDHKRQNGEVFPMDVLMTAVLFGERKILHVVWRDITERKHMEDELKHMATHDALTGLYNRNVLDQRLNDEIHRASRYNHTLSVFMLDIDYFKPINDTYGHGIGDTVLHNFAKVLESSIRNTDYTARYGGEEFVVILPETPLPKAEELAERLRNQVAEYPFPIGDDKDLNLTVSIGIATFPENAQTGQQLLEVADSAMYAAKEAGRNQVKTA